MESSMLHTPKPSIEDNIYDYPGLAGVTPHRVQ